MACTEGQCSTPTIEKVQEMVSAFFEDEAKGTQEKEVSSGQALRGLLPFLQKHTLRLVYSLVLLVGVIVCSLAWPLLIQNAIDGPITGQIGFLR